MIYFFSTISCRFIFHLFSVFYCIQSFIIIVCMFNGRQPLCKIFFRKICRWKYVPFFHLHIPFCTHLLNLFFITEWTIQINPSFRSPPIKHFHQNESIFWDIPPFFLAIPPRTCSFCSIFLSK